MTVGERIRHLRHAAGMTLEDCAHAAGWARASSWADVEHDRRAARVATLRRVAAVLGVPIAELL